MVELGRGEGQLPRASDLRFVIRAFATRPTPTRRCDRTPTAIGAVGGATSAPDALPLPPGALSARSAIQRPTTGAWLRAAESGEVTRAHKFRPSSRTVAAYTSRRLTPAPRRGGSGRKPRGGGRLPYHAGSGRLCSQGKSPHPRRQRGGRGCWMTRRWRHC